MSITTAPIPATSAAAATPFSTSSLPQEEQDELKAAIFKRLHPRVYLERFVAENVRPDGREFGEWRPVSVDVGSISTADGSSLVKLGETIIVCGVKAEIAEPELERPNEGFLVPNLDLPAMCSAKFKPGPPSEEAQVVSDRLNEAILASDMLSLRSLCIEPGKAAWVLYVDATCLSYDGNVFDAALLAMVAALINTRLPKATFDEEAEHAVCSRNEKSPLAIERTRLPIAMSFGIFDSSRIFSDPTTFEQPLLDAQLSVVLDPQGDIIVTSQIGAPTQTWLSSSGEDALLSCIAAAKKRNRILTEVINQI
ncbi:hypothetical protein AMATHDRAFT_148629 [Amanita thiersii Skay4041]|uniref:Ribosomal RNA-processing protein 43 n=1 Tax=Amanita thiersii Skay4041 TaxID=703135 RepID=A0A2A9NFZ6_9AGAR|nr:hypothetical protein AMATHDRAFT_148629 [Amanita thiersii Skay4041]